MKKLLVLSMSMLIAMSASADDKEFREKFATKGASLEQIIDNISSYYGDITGKLCKKESLKISRLKKQGKSFKQAEKIMYRDKELKNQFSDEMEIFKNKKENIVTSKFLTGVSMNLILARTAERGEVYKKTWNNDTSKASAKTFANKMYDYCSMTTYNSLYSFMK